MMCFVAIDRQRNMQVDLMQPICTKPWVMTNPDSNKRRQQQQEPGPSCGHHMHAQPIQRCNNSPQHASFNPLHLVPYGYPAHEDNENSLLPRYKTSAAIHHLANIKSLSPSTGFAMPVCTYRGVAYETPARVTKTTVLQYERKVYGDRISDANTELRMVYRWVRH